MKLNYDYKTTEKIKYKSVFTSENLFLFTVSLMVFLIPLILGHVKDFPNQIIVGSLVNFLLAGSALYFSFKKSLPIILLPAIAAVLSGIIFGSFTIFLVYLIPFIWIGNALYVYFIKNFNLVNKINYFVSVLSASVIKSVFIFSATLGLVFLGLVPEILLIPMGLVQFATAIIGGFAARSTILLKK